ncbi:MAG: Aminotransferase, class III [uncultured Thermomicrobiales bacterium]|uniref:Aminotransferase, class III n=1 Tax=uncultured Thermomicrobiales bacterium TaxID=1645740 RepID=A0A6J4VPQ7_9BACT|nr:MAG: Aminotransferase, class III [uncultured Thermomicrobiales bacterium]
MTATWDTARLVEQDIAHMLHPVTNLHRHRQSGPLVIVRGEGSTVWDSDGKAYIDGFAGLWNVNVGHGRRELAEVAREQMARLAFQPTFFGLATPPAIELATKLAAMIPGPINHFQFTSGGAESNETALKIARYYWALGGQPDKVKIISRKMAYHGIAMGALAATGLPAYWQDFGPLTPGFVHINAPHAYRLGEGLSEAEFVSKLVEELEATIAREGADQIAAFIGEPVQGAGGVVPPPQSYWAAVSEVLKRHDILLIADEVITGFGRTGTMFGVQQYDVQPDIVSLAKGITSGYIPLGAVGVTDAINDRLSEPDRLFMHGFTYSGHPVACAVGLRNVAIVEDEELPANAAIRGEQLLAGLHDLGNHPNVGNVRGKGLMAIIEVVADRGTKEAFVAADGVGAKLQAATRARGLIVRCNDTGIAISPPLVITEREVDTLVNGIGEALREVLGA